jgi:hypothetical protein
VIYLLTRRLDRLAVFGIGVGLAACGVDESADPAVVRDSAGVQIVESRRPAWSEGAGWRLSTEPTLQIGVEEGPPENQFVRVEGVVRLPDGRIVVADAGTWQIRIFDSEGVFLAASGRSGDAPGEYRQITGLGYGPGDSLWVYDFGNRRFTVLTADGQLVRTMGLGGALSAVGAVGRLSDGSFVVREYWSSGSRRGTVQSGLGREPAAVAGYSSDGATLDTIGLYPGREVYIGSENGRAVMSAPLLARSASVAVWGDSVYVGDQERFEIRLYSRSGALKRIVRLLDVDLRVTQQDIERAVAARVAGEPPERRSALRAHLEAMDIPATRPAYSRLLVDSEGDLWVSDYSSFPVEPTGWRVFDPEGHLLGSTSMPDRFHVHQIGQNWVVGVWRDELGVEYVRLYGLDKGIAAQ